MSNENADSATVTTPLIAENGEQEQVVVAVPSPAPSPAPAASAAEETHVAPSTSEEAKQAEPEQVVVQAVQTLPNEYKFIQQRIPSKDSNLRFVLPAILIGFQIVFIILFAFFGNYTSKSPASAVSEQESRKYPMFLDLHAIALLGFGFLMTFLKRYGYGSIGFNLLLVAFVVQWALLIRGWIDLNVTCDPPANSNSTFGKFEIKLDSLINADFTAIAVLVSFGALLGKTTLTQLVVLAVIEVVVQVVNEYLNIHIIKAHDVGRSVYVHLFGALFGLAVSKVLNLKGVNSYKQASVYHSDIFSFVGTLFLWAFYPSFNGLLAKNIGDNGHTKAIINTVAAISASCVVTFATSNLIGKGKINALHVQHATIAGGIAIGSVADLNVQVYIALIVGSLAGLVATLGYQYIDPFLRRTIKLHDTCGVQSLHALPGFIAGIIGIIFAACASYSDYNEALYDIYPGRCGNESVALVYHGIKSLNRTAAEQSAFQAAALFITIGLALASGAVTGLLLRLPLFEKLTKNVEMFDDEVQWVTPDDYALKLTLAPSESKKDDTKV